MSITAQQAYSPGVLSMLPLFYVGWSDSVLSPSEMKMIHQKIPRLKIHHNAAQIKNDVFIHKRFIPPVLAYIIPA